MESTLLIDITLDYIKWEKYNIHVLIIILDILIRILRPVTEYCE